jgi:hypothetical protein
MNNNEFQRLLAYQKARRYAPRQAKQITSRRQAKTISKRAQGRPLVPLERLFITAR